MRTILIFSLVIFSCLTLFSQTVNGIPLEEIDTEYVMITGEYKGVKKGVVQLSIVFDFGQEERLLSFRNQQIRDENGDVLVFNSIIDALNFLSKHGYSFVQAFSVSDSSFFILRKLKTGESVGLL